MKKSIITQRLVFNLLTINDLQDTHDLLILPETDQFNALGIPENINTTERIIKPWIVDNEERTIQNFTFTLRLKTDETFIGLLGLKLGNKKYQKGEIWYKIHKDYWGKSYASEAVNKIIEFGFEELNLHRIEAGVAVLNIASIRVLEKARMTREGRMRQVLPLKSGWSDNFEYGILDTDIRNKSM